MPIRTIRGGRIRPARSTPCGRSAGEPAERTDTPNSFELAALIRSDRTRAVREDAAPLRPFLDGRFQLMGVLAHEAAEERLHAGPCRQPADDPSLQAEHALVAKAGAAGNILQDKPVPQEVKGALKAFEVNGLGLMEGHPLDRPIDLFPSCRGGDQGVELDELPLALIP